MKRLTTEQFIEKAKIVHDGGYDYSKVKYVNNHTKVCITCLKHGDFWITPNNFLDAKQNCVFCSKQKTTNDFVVDSCKVHGDRYDYSKVDYKNNYTKVCIICPEHGEFWQQPAKHLHGCGCPICNHSKGEAKIELYLKNKNIKYFHDEICLDFLGRMRPDFYLPDYNLIIEYQGEQHFKPVKYGNMTKEQAEERLIYTVKNDKLKETLCNQNSVKIIKIAYFDYKNIEPILDGCLKIIL